MSICSKCSPVPTCIECGRSFVSDNTPMAQDGVCMRCRPGVEVQCRDCGAACQGAYDGQKVCPLHRSERLGTNQKETFEALKYERDLLAAGLRAALYDLDPVFQPEVDAQLLDAVERLLRHQVERAEGIGHRLPWHG